MSYSELRQHAVRIEELAFQRTLDQWAIAALEDGRFVAKSDMASIPAEVIADIRDQCAGISDIFEPFLNLPNPAALNTMHQNLIEATALLATAAKSVDPIQGSIYRANPNMTRISTIEEALTDWHGYAGLEFKRSLQIQWPAVAQNQFSLLSVLAGAISAERALWEECQNSVDRIAHHVIEALERMGRDTSVDGEVILLTVASSVFAVGAALTGGASAVTLTAAGAATQVAATVVDKSAPEPDDEVHFDAVSPLALVEQLKQALFKLQFVVLRKEQQIADALTGSSETVTAFRSEFVSPRPALADQTARTITTDQGLGELL